MKLNLDSIKNKKLWNDQGFELPAYDIEAVRNNTKLEPTWIHFGAGNIFRVFPARLQDELLDNGEAETGVIIAETRNTDKIDYIFKPYDNLSTAVTLKADGTLDLRVVGCLAEGVKVEQNQEGWARAEELFARPSLQVVSFTITEKGYSIVDHTGDYTAEVKAEMQDSSLKTTNSMGIICLLLYKRFEAGKLPLTLLSMDNVSHNGKVFRQSVLAYAKAWTENGFLPQEFYDYIADESRVSFPWSMIDKITPAADESVAEMLAERGYQDTEFPVMNGRRLPPSFVNAEETEYLVIEDSFTNGRPNWHKAGVIFTDRETVDRVETMKVTTCLNPLHTALAIFGCLLEFELINQEMTDADLLNLIKGVGYIEGLPVVVDPGILDPKAFIDTVIEQRFPNPFLPDTPQRIATDTSQKIQVRYGKTLQSYSAQDPEKIKDLIYIPAVLAGWLRYLLAIDDSGKEMELSPDPLLETLQEQLAAIEFSKNDNVAAVLSPILSNSGIFGLDLAECGLAEKVIQYFVEMNKGTGAVRQFLQSLPRVD
ncbi:MAG TPA: mannitol dehydrogenase family protein [Clostridiaceae bacterium]|nr:mannitol dehydrogenase family protein [Clostridiaceae bacterium]